MAISSTQTEQYQQMMSISGKNYSSDFKESKGLVTGIHLVVLICMSA